MTQKHAVIVTGDRKWEDVGAVYRELQRLPQGAIVIHGDAAGADTAAHMCIESCGQVEVRVPYLKRLGRSGGPARNGYMLKLLLGLQLQDYSIKVLAFHANLDKSRGTRDMVKRAEKAGVSVRKFTC